jgi:predicted glycosyltransferase
MKYRVALYSHDTMGIGHMRRNLLIAQGLADGPCPPVMLLIAGAREVNAFSPPAGADCLSLPALYKEGNERYRSRHLELSLEEIIALRARSIAAALEAFEPDVFIVDKVPRGVAGELDLTLAALRASGRTRCVLGLRDVLDDPATVQREWCAAGNEEVIRTCYDAIWVYGDPSVYDPVVEYGFPADISAKVRFTGYLDQRRRTRLGEVEGGEDFLALLAEAPERLVLCLLGGGQDGARLAEAFAQAELPPNTTAALLTGPLMPPAVERKLRATAHPRLRMLRFVTDSDLLLDRADRVVAMGGYNTVCEVLSYDKQALIVPRVHPRQEQYLRAERLRELGLLDVLHPSRLSPAAISAWLAQPPRPRPPARSQVRLDGLDNLPALLAEVLQAPSSRGHHQRPQRRARHAVS